MHYLLFYNVADDYVERRAEFRNEHLKLAWEFCDRGELILGGALADPVDTSILLFKGDDERVVNKFIEADPYVKNGLVKGWRIRKWTTVVGDLADNPLKP